VANTFAPYEIFIAATIIYLVLVWIIQTAFSMAETYANRHVRKG
jgi:polar amino acid transport system permease protein